MDWLRQVLNQVSAAFRAMTAAQRASMLMLGMTIVIALGLVVVLGGRPKFVIVASGLDQAEMREASSLLEQHNMEYKPDAQRGAILVPQDRQPAAANILNKSSVVSKEKIFDQDAYRGLTSSNLIMSQQERLKMRRDAQSGELRKSITGLDGVESCRVIITDAAENDYIIQPEKVGVSVTIMPRAGKKIDQPFATSVIDLVLSAVGNCDPAKVSVVDTRNPGRVFHKEDTETEIAMSGKRLSLTREYERYYKQKYEELIAGAGYAGAVQVNVEIDLDKARKVVKAISPDTTVTVVQKTHKVESTGAIEPSGPVGITAANPDQGGITAAGTGTYGAPAAGRTGTPSINKVTDSEMRTEFGYICEEIMRAPGKLTKLSATAVIFHRVVQKKDEKTGKIIQVFVPPTEDDKKFWKNALATTLGLDKPDNIDELKAITVCFMPPAMDTPDQVMPETPRNMVDVAAGYWPYARVGGVLLLAAAALFFLYGLGKRAATAPPAEVILPAGGASPEVAGEVASTEPEDVKFRQMQERIRSMIGQDPRKVASLVKRWLLHES